MELSVKLLRDTSEILIEHVDSGSIRVFNNLSDALDYIKRVLEEELKRKQEECQRQEESLEELSSRTWYIRFPLTRLFSALRFLYEKKIRDVKRGLEEYCKAAGLSKSNIRAIVPTFVSLGLQEGNKLTEKGNLVAKYLSEGKLEQAADVLFECAVSNSLLREILQELWSTDMNSVSEVVKSVLARHGYSRHDEVNYTSEFVKFLLRHSCRCRCYVVCNIVRRYLREKRRAYINSIPKECLPDVTYELLSYLLETRPYILQSVLDPAGLRIDQIQILRESDKILVIGRHSEHVVQILPRVLITRDILYASALRQELDKLRGELLQRARNNRTSYLITMLILVNDIYTRLKLYLEHLIRDQSFSTKIIDLP